MSLYTQQLENSVGSVSFLKQSATCHCTHSNSVGSVSFLKQSKVNELHLMTAAEICI